MPRGTPAPFLRSVSMAAPPAEGGDRYPFTLPYLRDGLSLGFTTPVTVFAGENGSGKSTLLEAIALHCGFAMQGGNRDHWYDEPESVDVKPLTQALRFSWSAKVTDGFLLRAESLSGFADTLDRRGPDWLERFGGQSLHARSHGEAFMAVFETVGKRPGIYLFDEPEAALSPTRQLAFLRILHAMGQSKACQVVLATHSPILMAVPGAQLLWFDEEGISPRDWRSTPHARVYKRFLGDPDSYLADLLDDIRPDG